MDYLKIIAGLFGATGFWKLVEILINYMTDKRRQSAEIKHLSAQAESHIVGNWIQWSQTLEKRVKELEAVAEENKMLQEQIENQRNRIVELEEKVEKVERENEQLRSKLNGLF